MSATPPGGKGTIIVTAREGYVSCENEMGEKSETRMTSAMRDMDLLRTGQVNTLLHNLHFIGSLQRRCRV